MQRKAHAWHISSARLTAVAADALAWNLLALLQYRRL
jgi:hypothetical protein